MEIRDKELKKNVHVCSKNCPLLECYYPRSDPGSFTHGVGYSFRSDDWLCGTRAARGCPMKTVVKQSKIEEAKKKKNIISFSIKTDELTDEQIAKFLQQPRMKSRMVSAFYKELEREL